MFQLIQHNKHDILSHFNKSPFETLPEGFQTLIEAFPDVLTRDTLSPIAESHSFVESDEAILPSQKPNNKPFYNKAFHFQNQQPQQSQSINQNLGPPILALRTQAPPDNYKDFTYKARSLIRTPFSSSGFTTELGERVWFYIDEQNEIQGPFTTLEMDSWFEKGFLFDELKICHSMTNKFFPLYDLFVNEKVTKSMTLIEPENQNIDKMIKKKNSDIGFKEHLSNRNETKMFETLQNVLTQPNPGDNVNSNDNNQSIERNIKQFNVIYPNIHNNNVNVPSQNANNSYITPINPNFNPLLSQQQQTPQPVNRVNTFKNETQTLVKTISSYNSSINPNIPLTNLVKSSSDIKTESSAMNHTQSQINQSQTAIIKEKLGFFNTHNISNSNNQNQKKDNEKNNNFPLKPAEKPLEKLEKRDSKNENDLKQQEKKTIQKTEYVKVYEPKKSITEKEQQENQTKEVKTLEKNNFEYLDNDKLLKDLKQNKGNIDKEKYFVIYKPKQVPSQELIEDRERKLSNDKEDLNQDKKKSKKKNRKMHSSNSPEKDLGQGEVVEKPPGKFNTHFYSKEQKNSNNIIKNKPSIVKEYILKK